MNSSRSVILITNWTHQVITRHIFLQVIRVGSFVFQRVIKTTAFNCTVISYSNTIITATTIKSYSEANRIIDKPFYYFNYLFQLPSSSITLTYFPPGLSYFSRDWALSKVTLIEIQIYKIPCRLISLWLAGMIFHYVISSLP